MHASVLGFSPNCSKLGTGRCRWVSSGLWTCRGGGHPWEAVPFLNRNYYRQTSFTHHKGPFTHTLRVALPASENKKVLPAQRSNAQRRAAQRMCERPIILTSWVFGDPLDVVAQAMYVEMFAVELRALALSEVHRARRTVLRRVQIDERHWLPFLQRGATVARYILSSCVSVSPSQARVVSKRSDESFFGTEASFHLAHTVLQRHSGISKIWVLSSGTLTKTLKNFATANRSSCQQYSSTVEIVDDIYNGRRVVYTGRRVVAIYYTSNNCNLIITLSLWFVLDLSRYSFL